MEKHAAEQDLPLVETYAERNMRLAVRSGDMGDIERAHSLTMHEKLGQLATFDISHVPDMPLTEEGERAYRFFAAAHTQERAFRVGDQAELERQNQALLAATRAYEQTE